MELLAQSHMKSLYQRPRTSHPIPSSPLSLSLCLSPPWSSFVLARVEHLTVSLKKPLQTGKCEYSRFSSTISTHECLPGIFFPPLGSYKCVKGVSPCKTLTSHISQPFSVYFTCSKGSASSCFSTRTNTTWNLAFVLCGFHLEINFSGWHPLKQTTAEWWRPTLGTNSVITVNQAFWLLVLHKYIHAKSLHIY